MKNALYVLLGVMAGFVLAGVLVFVSRAPAGNPITLQPAPTEAPIAVHVIGAVPRPGLYEFPEGTRVQDAINAAGGLLAEASTDALNLAALLEDGQQLSIPYQVGSEPVINSTTLELPSSATEVPSVNPDVELININGELEELQLLVGRGIGPTVPQKILDYRLKNGPFTSIDQILNVQGINLSTYDTIKTLVTVN